MGASDLSAIFNISKYKTQFELAKEKILDCTSSETSNEYAKYGQLMEPKIREYVNNDLYINFVEDSKTIEELKIRGNVDGIDRENNKTVLVIQRIGAIMSLLESIIMGIIQGATEFLPVSSSGHLAIFKNMFHVNTDTGIMFDILLHFGTLVAIFIVYWKDIVELIVEGFTIIGLACCNVGRFFANLFSKEKKPYRKIIETEYRKFVMLVILSTLVTMVIALPFESKIENAGNTLLVPGFCLCITSAFDKYLRDVRESVL